MSCRTAELYRKGLIQPPPWLPDQVAYESLGGSHSYGTHHAESDFDIVGFAIPPKDIVFPHLQGIIGFATQVRKFDKFIQQGIVDKEARKEYDFAIYGIVRFFSLCMDCNPNMIETLFTPTFCVQHTTAVGQLVRENRKLFLHKGGFHKLKGYAFSQLSKMSREPQGKRKELVEKHGFDTKFALNVVRLMLECEQLLEEGDLDLLRNREHLKAILRGEISEEDIRKWATDKERHLENLYATSTLRHSPDEEKIGQLLIDCLEMHYGDLSEVLPQGDKAKKVLREIQDLLTRNQKLLA